MNSRNDEYRHIAEAYVMLVLGVGAHDPDYVDAYFGPQTLREKALAAPKSLPDLKGEAGRLIARLDTILTEGMEEIELLRHAYLRRQLQSMTARIDMLTGTKFMFDDEAGALYDAVPPVHNAAHFSSILADLGAALPGPGSVSERYDRFKADFIIPKEKLDTVFQAAIRECRRRTLRYIALPADEHFVVEYVNNKPWSGYNWYKGNSFSLIQVNTDLPIYIDRAIDLAAHEGYPGHHVYNSLLDVNLFRSRSWVEFSIYALFSPQSLIAEGTANFGIDVAFPGSERTAFERETLFPLAGLDPGRAESYYAIHALFGKLAYAGNEAARHYLNGAMTRDEAVAWLVEYALMAPDRALQRTKFFDAYRSYVINYNLGQDIVRAYIERRGGTPAAPERRWKEFAALIGSPRLPSGLMA